MNLLLLFIIICIFYLHKSAKTKSLNLIKFSKISSFFKINYKKKIYQNISIKINQIMILMNTK